MLSGCGGAPRRVVSTPTLPLPVDVLQNDLRGIFESSDFNRSTWSVLVRPAAGGDTLYALNAGKLVLPGSNMKLLTLAAAAQRLGWDYRFETRLAALAPVESGVLEGDLFIIGSGDPSISERSDDPGVLKALARQLHDAGVQRVDGNIIGDDDAFEDNGFGAGWAWDNLPYGYSAPVTALEYNEGSVDLVVHAGPSAGDAVTIEVRPEGSGLEVDNQLTTVSETSPGMLTLERTPGSSHLVVRGRIPAGAAPFARTASVENPTEFFARAFRLALLAEGVHVAGGATDLDLVVPKPDLTSARSLVTRRSPPLSELARSMMKVSQNQYAELLLRAVGGTQSVRDSLHTLGIPDDSYFVADGSGLSRYNFVTDETLVAILQRFSQRPADRPFIDALPIAGRDGTLARRLVGTPAEGRVRAKSGTVDNVRAISGYLDDADGETLVFSIIANNFISPTAQIDTAADRAIVRLVGFRRSRAASADAAPAAPAPPQPSGTRP